MSNFEKMNYLNGLRHLTSNFVELYIKMKVAPESELAALKIEMKQAYNQLYTAVGSIDAAFRKFQMDKFDIAHFCSIQSVMCNMERFTYETESEHGLVSDAHGKIKINFEKLEMIRRLVREEKLSEDDQKFAETHKIFVDRNKHIFDRASDIMIANAEVYAKFVDCVLDRAKDDNNANLNKLSVTFNNILELPSVGYYYFEGKMHKLLNPEMFVFPADKNKFKKLCVTFVHQMKCALYIY